MGELGEFPEDVEGLGGMSKRAAVAFSLLMASSVYCLRKCHVLAHYARAGFRLYLASGFFGVAYYGTTKIEHMTEIYQVIWTWSYCLGMPLLASDLVVYAGLPLDTTPLNLVIPAYTLIQYHLGSNLPVDVDLLRISHFSSTLLMLVVSLLCERVTAFWTAFLYTIAFSNVELDDIDDGSKAALWAILVSAANLRLLPALRLDL